MLAFGAAHAAGGEPGHRGANVAGLAGAVPDRGRPHRRTLGPAPARRGLVAVTAAGPAAGRPAVEQARRAVEAMAVETLSEQFSKASPRWFIRLISARIAVRKVLVLTRNARRVSTRSRR